MKVPSWLSKQLFEDALRSFYNNVSIEILSFSTNDAVAEGENFTCDLFRTKIIYRESDR